ncbi:hypothetical Protein ERS011763_04625 [Salmonella enterica subsp. enterica serovar Typhimurium str. DT104]|nr:hypothetical Protein ERS011763_04625 [Salmonella enterica subsp. enterica serovar Typhimurium str. DT104]
MVQTRDTVQRRSVDDREVQLFVGRVEVNKQVEYLVNNPVRARARTVNFVDNHNGFQAMSKGFFGHEARLRHRAVKCVNHQQHRVNHGHDALYFTTEVSVPGSINDVDTVIIPFNSGVFSEDSNTTLFLQIVGVHHSLLSFGTRVERTGLLEQLINQGSFTMVNVRDDGDVTQIFDHNFASGIRNSALLYTD